ncbi:MAG TPA: methylated-DNA--[protein]-cysteine S-methyltransferase [Dehalococcoidia bacterium]|nr:methylated-DNA--[protein]-cysteine S-methyltransferase [Dehalococcoidia bacterium]
MNGASREPLALAAVETPFGAMRIACSDVGLVLLALPGREAGQFSRRLEAIQTPDAAASPRAAAYAAQTGEELAGYFAGALREFSVPLAPRGTAFQRVVWQAVCAVPYGETRSYGAVAAAIGRPAAFRAVGHANGANPLPVIVPCHRLVGSTGALTGYGGGLQMKRWLIEQERCNSRSAT